MVKTNKLRKTEEKVKPELVKRLVYTSNDEKYVLD